MDELPKFRLCHPKYWEDNDKPTISQPDKFTKPNAMGIKDAMGNLSKLTKPQ